MQQKVIGSNFETGIPEKNPVFIEKRVYQGSSGSVYPYPVTEKIEDEKVDKDYQAVFLENEFVKIMILPELGGRVQMAYDKTKSRHFVYYNHVIKPALVGLTGPWISGGIEFNWPQHHRPTTFSPVDFAIEKNQDGSATVWCSELERMFRTKGMAGFTLYPDKNYLEIKVKLYNGTTFPQTFLWWANPAVKVNDDYQSVFPPDVNAVFDHGKRDVSSFPIATGTYYKVDYTPGTDISKYRNIPVPTSYMAITSKYDFVGGYENDVEGGLLHVANHHVSPGKKQWTWGNGDFGKAWDRNLTDKDGPYIELMCGVFTDNQPDFSWLAPNEQKDFVQYFMPYRDLGVVKNATKDAMVSMDYYQDLLTIKTYTTGIFNEVTIRVFEGQKIIYEKIYDASPRDSFIQELSFKDKSLENIYIELLDTNKKVLVNWRYEGENNNDIPDPAKPAKLPSEIASNEQLYLTGLHLEQYRHATYSPEPYYKEAIKRDPKDIRSNNALGLLLLRKGRFKDAEPFFKTAVESLTERSPNPYEGEPLYNLGLCLKYQGRTSEAYDYFYKCTWNSTYQNVGYFQVALIDCLNKDYQLALKHVEKSLARNSQDHKTLHLKIVLLRKLQFNEIASIYLQDYLNYDHFNFGLQYEKYLLSKDEKDLNYFKNLIRGNIHNYIEYALDYAAAGMFNEAISLLKVGITADETYPMAYYYLALFFYEIDQSEETYNYLSIASNCSPDYCFPHRLECVHALKTAISLHPEDDKARYYLGNYWYAGKNYKNALECWEEAIKIEPNFPTAHRNLALAYFNKADKAAEAIEHLEKAFNLNPLDARILMELDQLYKRCNYELIFRLLYLEEHLETANKRDDIYLERATLYNLLGRPEKAYRLITNRKFHPWEGGEGKVITQYLTALIVMARDEIMKRNYHEAIDLLNRTRAYPENLGEGKLEGTSENDIDYWTGLAYSKIGKENKAVQFLEKATKGPSEPSAAIYYNDQQPDKIFYQGLALLRLNQESEAQTRFQKLIEYGQTHIDDHITIDYFAVSLPDLLIWEGDLDLNNKIHCLYMQGLGYLGLGKTEKALEKFNQVLSLDKSHLGVVVHKSILSLIENTIQSK